MKVIQNFHFTLLHEKFWILPVWVRLAVQRLFLDVRSGEGQLQFELAEVYYVFVLFYASDVQEH